MQSSIILQSVLSKLMQHFDCFNNGLRVQCLVMHTLLLVVLAKHVVALVSAQHAVTCHCVYMHPVLLFL